MYSLRIVSVEYYMATPIVELDPLYSEFRSTEVQQVPVLRIFGPSLTGIKTCLHIHGVFPYIYIPCPENNDVNSFIYQIASALDKAINISLGETNSTVQHVYKILLVSGIPFYGYHAQKHQFLKIYFYNPLILRKACHLLQNGSILGKIYQPHESHINFTLQFMIDYNLHGMNFINLSQVKYRVSPTGDTPSDITLPSTVKRISTSLVEIDALAQNINRHTFQVGAISNPGIAALWEDEKQRLRNKNEDSQITPQISQSRENVLPSKSHVGYMNVLKERLQSFTNSLDSTISEYNNSVYPSESVDETNVLDASQIHFSASSAADGFNQTVLDEHAVKFLQVLRDLGEMDNAEEGSILSQTVLKEDCDDESEKQEEHDLNLTLADLDIEGDFWDESFNIPQVDGPLDRVNVRSNINTDNLTTEERFILPIKVFGQLDGCFDDSSSSDEEIRMKKQRLGKLKARKRDIVDKEELGCSYKRKKCMDKTKCLPLDVSVALLPNLEANLTAAEKYDLKNKVVPVAAASTSNATSVRLENRSSSDIFFGSSKASVFQAANFIKTRKTRSFMPKFNPPTKQDILNTLSMYKIPEIDYEKAFYSCVKHVTGKQEIGHSVMKISSKSSIDCPEFLSSLEDVQALQTWRNSNYKLLNPDMDMENVCNIKGSVLCKGRSIVLEPNILPPSFKNVKLWLEKQHTLVTKREIVEPNIEEKLKLIVPTSPGGNDGESENEDLTLTPISSPEVAEKKQDSEQLTGITLNETYGFKVSLNNFQEARAVTVYQYITLLLVEVHVQTRADFMPNPELDPIRAIFYSIFDDIPETSDSKARERCGAFVVKTLHGAECDILQGTGCEFDYTYAQNEENLLHTFAEFVKNLDPDIVGGYEIEMASWGYVVERAAKLGINMLPMLSRIPSARRRYADDGDGHSDLKLEGRIVLDIWRLMRHEIALQSYTFESIIYHILHYRVPKYSFKELSHFWEHRSGVYRRFTVDYYKLRVQLTLQLLHQLDLIGRTSELARLFGIQFYEVLSRGSQFRVESMMLRLAKPLNYVAVSPSVQQRAKMRAPEYLPLILEPASKMYVDPVIVLDFQSLYPSMIIAYNYCYSTCLGRLEHYGSDGPFEFGATMLKTSKRTLTNLQDDVNFSPIGVAFVKPSVRQGILPTMLKEILETRLMVKKSMKQNKKDKGLQRVLHSRQLGLKLIANVTYGYTSANFSGRMPCVEIGDSVVSKGRETLERAIKLVESNENWNAKVVYGDTDSLFVMVKGRSKDAAFKIGDEICEAVNADNPQPVKLKLEKVYQPCILQTKKRYVGYMYESSTQQEPQFEAKGIETVRRDGCPAVSKMLEKSLRLLFETKDVSLIRNYVCRQFTKLLSGKINVQDLVFAKEYRGAKGYRPGACVPALELARKWTQVDKRREPRRSERVPYIIVNGPPGVPLIRLVRSPMELVTDPGLTFNALYYITKVIIPPLNRCFTLIGADLNMWFNDMSRKSNKQSRSTIAPNMGKKSTIAQYFATSYCILCNTNQTKEGICTICKTKPQVSIVNLQNQINGWEQTIYKTDQICKSCSGQEDTLTCISLDCPIFYKRSENSRNVKEIENIRNIIGSFQLAD